MKFVSQCALVGVLFASCAVPVEIADDVQFTSPDASIGAGGGGALGGGSGGAGPSGASGAGGSVAQGGAGVSTGGTGFTQGGTGGALAQGGGGAGGMGGSMMATGGGAGAGMGGAGVEPPPDNCVETGSVGGFNVEVFYTENVQAQTIGMTLAIRSTGTAFNTNQLRVRYWFTPGTAQPFEFACYYAQSGAPANATITADVNVTFGQNDVSAFAEVTVNRDEPIGVGINQIQLAINSEGFANLLHTDDFSFVDAALNMVNRNMSAYVGTQQVFGCEPPDP